MVKDNSSMFKDYSPISSLLADARILTSCDGLLLSVLNKKMQKLFLFNPFSGECKVFPPYGARFCHGQRYGICYDFSGNDYKVMCIEGWTGLYPKPSLAVFSFKINSWTRTRFVPNWIVGIDWTVPVSLNGALHWSVWHRNEMLCFDLKDEFKQVPGPPEEIFSGNFFCLGALRGNLCAWGSGLGLDTFLVMEMKQYGVKESWTRVCSINIGQGNNWMAPMAFTKKGELVTLVDGKELAIYNVEDNSSKTIMRFGEVMDPKRREMAIYADSSINLDCDCWLNTKRRID